MVAVLYLHPLGIQVPAGDKADLQETRNLETVRGSGRIPLRATGLETAGGEGADVAQPTAVIANMWVDAHAFIASRDGTITAYHLGGLSTRLPPPPRESSPLVRSRWPAIHLHGAPNIARYLFGRVSRDREVAGCLGRESVVTRRLRDSRLVDPVFAEVSDTHGIEAPIVTVVDFKGRQNRELPLRPATFATQGGAKFGGGCDWPRRFRMWRHDRFSGLSVLLSATNVN